MLKKKINTNLIEQLKATKNYYKKAYSNLNKA